MGIPTRPKETIRLAELGETVSPQFREGYVRIWKWLTAQEHKRATFAGFEFGVSGTLDDLKPSIAGFDLAKHQLAEVELAVVSWSADGAEEHDQAIAPISEYIDDPTFEAIAGAIDAFYGGLAPSEEDKSTNARPAADEADRERGEGAPAGVQSLGDR